MIRDISRSTLRTLGSITIAWALVFAVVHLYWAFGGGIGVDETADSIAVSLYIAAVAGIGFLSAAVARGLSSSHVAAPRARRLRLLARIGGGALLIGVVVGTGRSIAGTDAVDASWIVITGYFLLGGVLFTVLGWARAESSPDPAAA